MYSPSSRKTWSTITYGYSIYSYYMKRKQLYYYICNEKALWTLLLNEMVVKVLYIYICSPNTCRLQKTWCDIYQWHQWHQQITCSLFDILSQFSFSIQLSITIFSTFCLIPMGLQGGIKQRFQSYINVISSHLNLPCFTFK